MSRRFAIVLAVCAAGLLAPGCKKDAPSGAPPTATPAGVPEVAPKSLRIPGAAEKPVLLGLPALALLPKSVSVIGASDGLFPTLERLGWSEAVKAWPLALTELVEGSTRVLGKNITTEEGLVALGVDPRAPVGGAVFRDGALAAALFARVTDASKVAGAIRVLMINVREELAEEKVGDATVLTLGEKRTGEHIAWVLRGDVGVMVFADKDAPRIARDMAKRSQAESFAAHPRASETLNDLQRGAQLSAWMDVDEALEGLVSVLRNVFGSRDAQLVQLVVREAFGKGAELAFGASIHDQSVELVGRLRLASDAPFRAIFKGPGMPSVVHAIQQTPVIAGGARLDLDALYKSIRRVAGASGGSIMDAIKGTVQSTVGVDLERLSDLFTGDVGFVVAGSPDFAVNDEAEFAQGFSGAFVLGLVDGDRAKALIEAVRKLAPAEVSRRLRDTPGGYTVDIPEWKTLTLALSKTSLVVTPDAALVAAVAEKKPATSAVAGVQEVLRSGEAVLFAAVDIGFFGEFLLMRKSSAYTPPAPPGLDAAALAVIDAKQKEVDRLRAEREKAQNAMMKRLAGFFGVWAGRSVSSPEGFDGGLTVFMSTSTKGVLPFLFEVITREHERRVQSEALWKLEGELSDLRWKRPEPQVLEPPPGTVEAPPIPLPLPVEPAPAGAVVAPVAPAPETP